MPARVSDSWPHWLRAGLVAVVVLGTAGAAWAQLAETHIEQLRRDFLARDLDPAVVVVPFDTTEEMRAWARKIPLSGDVEDRLDQLLRAILHRDGIALTYNSSSTSTALGVWKTYEANCLSFAHLYVGLARELGLPVYYLRVADLESFEKTGDLVVATRHIAAAYGSPSQRVVLDFTNAPVTSYREVQPISDLTAVALHYSDLGAHRIAEQDFAAAEELLGIALRLEPKLGEAWVNLGVALRRLNRDAEAEAALRAALEADPRLMPAYNNLAALLERQGRTREAWSLLGLIDQRRNRNPFSYLALGDLALRDGRISDAEQMFRRARRHDPQSAEPLAALGLCALAAGKTKEAERWLAKASRIDPDHLRTQELALRLGVAMPPKLTRIAPSSPAQAE